MKVADIFSGIGGCTLAARRAGFRPVFACEIDGKAAEVYAVNHGLRPAGDIIGVDPGDVPDHDLAVVGLPCTAFSALGHRRGFDDPREHVWNPALRILARKRPAAVVVENVQRLVNHDGGWSRRFLVECLRTLGYRVSWRVLDAADFGAAQVRRRVFVVGSLGRRFDFDPLPTRPPGRIADVLEADIEHRWLDPADYVLLAEPRVGPTGTAFAGYRRGSPWHPGRPADRPNTHQWQNQVWAVGGPCPTLTGRDCGYPLVAVGGRVRRLTRREVARLQGFPDSYLWPHPGRVPAQLGNSVHVPTVAALLGAVRDQMSVAPIRTGVPR